jgi:hypothetical protein
MSAAVRRRGRGDWPRLDPRRFALVGLEGRTRVAVLLGRENPSKRFVDPRERIALAVDVLDQYWLHGSKEQQEVAGKVILLLTGEIKDGVDEEKIE